MLDVLSVTGVVFVLIAIGYVSVLAGVFSAAELATLSKYVVNFALPSLVFHAISIREIGEFVDFGYLGAYLLGSVAVFAAGYVLARRWAGLQPIQSTFDGMGMSCSNSGFVGYPILMIAMPAVAPTALALNVIVENLFVIPLVLIMAERANGGAVQGWALTRKIAGRLARNPLTLALCAGLLVSVLGIPLPEIVSEPIGIIALSSAAISLFVIGGTLVGLPLRSVDARVLTIVAGKLLLHPLFVWIGFLVMATIGFGVTDSTIGCAGILFAAMPAMSIYPVLAGRYGQQSVAAIAMLVMTVLSFLTISTILWALDGIPVG